MARSLPKPWLRTRPSGKKEWMVTLTISGKRQQRYLADFGASDEQIQQRLLLLFNEATVQKGVDDPGFVAVMNRHLDHVKASLSAQTYRLRRRSLLSFRDYLKAEGLLTITCKQLEPFHVTGWWTVHPNWGENTRRLRGDCVKVCMNWAFDQGLLKQRVLERLKLPAYIPRGREVLLTAEQRRILQQHCRRQEHKDILVALYGSGCRPGEICGLQAENVYLDCESPFWVVRGKPTKKRPDGVRTVPLTEILAKLSKRLLQERQAGHLFLNTHGRPWTPDTIWLLFKRLRNKFKKKGIPMPPRLLPYGQRHCFAADLLANGANDFDVSVLMGHADQKMVTMVYGKHIPQNAKRALVHLQEVTDDGPKAVDAGSNDAKGEPAHSKASPAQENSVWW